jgi:hypothetical protein
METPKAFLKKEAFSFGWRGVMDNPGLFVALACIMFGVSLGSRIFSWAGVRSQVALPLIGLAFWVLQMIVQVGILKIALKFCEGVVGKVSDVFSQSRFFFRYLGASILYGFIVVAGCILLVVPGIVWGIKYGFFSYAMVDKDLGVMESLRWSAAITNGYK